MINRIEKKDFSRFIQKRRVFFEGKAAGTVNRVIKNVRKKGDKALYRYTAKFDGVNFEGKPLELAKEEIENAYATADPYFIETLNIAKENIVFYHERQKGKGFRLEKEGGVVLGQLDTPVEKAGIYVPGGTAAYPSSVLMNAIPAKIAGVEEIIMVSPPGKDGKIRKEVLAAAHIAGIDRVFPLGGAQAVAALAYGTESVPAVSKIAGPGNIYVALAKRAVSGVVGIDMIAGPSEILIVADRDANPAFVAADLLSQAEHDAMASPLLVTDSETLAARVTKELEKQIINLPREKTARRALKERGAVIVAGNLDECMDFSNAVAPEHLVLSVKDHWGLLQKVKNAGSVFLGSYTPESLGDYLAGPNHTIPTNGGAKFSSPLSVADFMKRTSYLYYPKSQLEAYADRVMDFAFREGLAGHGEAVKIRLAGRGEDETGKENPA